MSNVISARVGDEVLAMIDQLAASRERSRAWIVSKLVESAARRQTEMDDFLQKGIDDVEAGRTISHEEIEIWWEERKAARHHRIAAE